jgi:hypothetical protein
MKKYMRRPAEFNQDAGTVTGSIHWDGKNVNVLPPVSLANGQLQGQSQSFTLNTDGTSNAIHFVDWGESLGTYEIRLKPLLHHIVDCWRKKQTDLLRRPPFYLKPWQGLAPHPFLDPNTQCLEITVPPTSDYYIPVDGSESIDAAVQRVNNDEKQKVENEMSEGINKRDVSSQDREVGHIIKEGSDFKGRGIVRLIITADYNWFCISLFHNYKEGPDQRCSFFPDHPLPLLSKSRQK